MTLSTNELQQQRAKKQLEQKKNAKQLKPLSSSALHTKPVYETILANKIFETGMRVAIIARKNMDDSLAIACFKLDMYCLGVKDAFVSNVSYEQYRLYKERFKEQHLEIVEPGYLRVLIDGAVKFARACGFEPRGDFNKAMRHLSMFEPPDPLPGFEFGASDGTPLFVACFNDSQEMIYNVLDTLDGSDYLHYIMPLLSEPDFILDPDSAEDA